MPPVRFFHPQLTNSEIQVRSICVDSIRASKALFSKAHQGIFEVRVVDRILGGLDVYEVHVVGPASEDEGAGLQAPRPGVEVDRAEGALSHRRHEVDVTVGAHDGLFQ